MTDECECVVFDQPCEKCQEAALELNTFREREPLVQEVIDALRSWQLATKTHGNREARKEDLVTAARKLAEWSPT